MSFFYAERQKVEEFCQVLNCLCESFCLDLFVFILYYFFALIFFVHFCAYYYSCGISCCFPLVHRRLFFVYYKRSFIALHHIKKPGSKSKQWKMEKIELLESTYCCLLMWVYRFFNRNDVFRIEITSKSKSTDCEKWCDEVIDFFFLRAKTHFNIVRIACNLIVFRFYFIYHIFALLNSSVCSLVISLMTPFWTLPCDDVNVANVTNKMKQWHTLRRVM